MSGSRWVITSSWLSGSQRSFLYSSSVYTCHHFLIFSAYVRSLPFLSFIKPIFAWNVPLVSLIFLRRSLVFPSIFFPSISCIDDWGRLAYLSLLFFGTLHSNGYIFPFLLCLWANFCKFSLPCWVIDVPKPSRVICILFMSEMCPVLSASLLTERLNNYKFKGIEHLG